MAERFATPSAAVLMLLRMKDGKMQVLLQRRANTGFADGLWDLSCAGHVEENEPMTATVVREAQEELGITIDRKDLKFFSFVHKRDEACGLTYYNAYFYCRSFQGEIKIREAEKCSEIGWFDLLDLPKDLIDDRRRAVQCYFSGRRYVEYGWESE